MAITKIDWPAASAPDVTVDYPRQNNNLQAVVRGYNSVTLTNWDDSTAAPAVILGSVIECNGVLYEVTTANESITGVSSGVNYLIYNDATDAFQWSSSSPAWSTSKNGWYIGTYRWTGHRLFYQTTGATYSGRLQLAANKNHNNAPYMSAMGQYVSANCFISAGTTTTLDAATSLTPVTSGTPILIAEFLCRVTEEIRVTINVSLGAGVIGTISIYRSGVAVSTDTMTSATAAVVRDLACGVDESFEIYGVRTSGATNVNINSITLSCDEIAPDAKAAMTGTLVGY